MSKFAEANAKIAQTVVEKYKKVETGVVDRYRKIENGVVAGFGKAVDYSVAALFEKEGETVEEAKWRLAGNAQNKEDM